MSAEKINILKKYARIDVIIRSIIKIGLDSNKTQLLFENMGISSKKIRALQRYITKKRRKPKNKNFCGVDFDLPMKNLMGAKSSVVCRPGFPFGEGICERGRKGSCVFNNNLSSKLKNDFKARDVVISKLYPFFMRETRKKWQNYRLNHKPRKVDVKRFFKQNELLSEYNKLTIKWKRVVIDAFVQNKRKMHVND